MNIRKIMVSITVIVSLLAVGALCVPFLVSTSTVKLQLDARIGEITASEISYKGEPVLTYLPYLGVELHDIVMQGEKRDEQEPDLLHVEKLQFSLKILPLLFGKTRFSNFKLIRPEINLLVHEDGSANWARIGGKIEKWQDLVDATVVSTDSGDSGGGQVQENSTVLADTKLGKFEIFDGIVESKVSGFSTGLRVTNLHANVDWPNIASAWNIDGQGVWRGEAFEFSNRAEYPLALFTSGKSGLQVDFKSPTLIASFDGHATMVSDIQLLGNTSIATPSLPRLFELFLDEKSVAKPPFGNFLVRGSMSANAREVRFDETTIELGTNVATGNLLLHWNSDSRPKVSGTLAFTSLDVTPLIEIAANNTPQKAATEIGILDHNLIDFDVRFSAQNYKFRENNFGALAATAMASENEWTFDIGEAEFFGGTIVATIASKAANETGQIELRGILGDVSLGNLARDLYGGEIVPTGNAHVDFNLKAPRNTRLDDFREFFGSMKLTLTDGQIDGVDLVKAIPALIKNNGFVTVDEIKGITPFNNLALDMLIYNGVGWITKGHAQSSENEFRLSGKADLLRGGLAIYTDINQKQTAGNPGQRARIFIGGTIKNPLVTRSAPPKSRPDERVRQDD